MICDLKNNICKIEKLVVQKFKPNQIYSLQIFRAIAALSVVYFHLENEITFGSFGVDLFFVLSGFVIAMTVSKTQSPLNFIINRITRLVPLYWLLTFAMLCLALLFPGLLNSTTADLSNFIKSILFIPYFKENGALHPMLAVGWSLNYEMLFYALVTIGILINQKYIYTLTSLIVILAYCLGSFLANSAALQSSMVTWQLDYKVISTFLNSEFILEFCFGILAYKLKDLSLPNLVKSSVMDKLQYRRQIILIVSILFIIACYAFMAVTEYMKLGAFNRLLYFGLPSLVIILLCLQIEPELKKIIYNNSVYTPLISFGVYLGDASYALYLSHLFVIEAVRKLLPKIFILFSGPAGIVSFELNSIGGNLLAIGLSIFASCILYSMVDKPAVSYCKQLFRKLLKPRLVVTASRGY